MQRHDPVQIQRARAMRRDPAPAEALLWWGLRKRELGVRFRRQHPVGPYIADFACVRERLAVEVDGRSHVDPERDARRDRWFAEQGWRVIRVADSEVCGDLEAVLDQIRQELHGPVDSE